MVNVATVPNTMDAPPAASNGLPSSRAAFAPPGGQSFSQLLPQSKTVQPQPPAKPNTKADAQRGTSSSNDLQRTKPPKNLELQPASAVPVAVPTNSQIPAAPAQSVPEQLNPQMPGAGPGPEAPHASAISLADSETFSPQDSASLAATVAGAAQNDNASNNTSSQPASTDFKRALDEQVPMAQSGAIGDQGDVTSADDATVVPSALTEWQPEAPQINRQTAQATTPPHAPQPNSSANPVQPVAVQATTADDANAAVTLSPALTDAAIPTAAVGAARSVSDAQPSPQSPELIAQRIQPGLPSVGAPPIVTATSAVQSILAANNSGGAGTNNSGNSAAPANGHSTGQGSDSSANAHSSDNSKPTRAADSAQPSNQQSNGGTAPPQNPPTAASLSAPAVPNPTPPTHVAAQITPQTTDSASAPPNAPSSQAQLPSHIVAVQANVPQSLADLSQATQLYQRVGGAEIHVSMNTDLLGSIDLRAVVHQGSLSATIGVQRADVQTLLVNELPALQHSLAEKNFQVSQISVLAGSIGSGANPNRQSSDQQNRRQAPASLPTPLFCGEPASTLISRANLSEITRLAGLSTRLSVIA